MLAESGVILDAVHFSGDPGEAWIYGIRNSPLSAPTVAFEQNRMFVAVGPEDIEKWLCAEEVGIYFSVDIGPYGELDVALEKDFACLDRSDEDNADSFPNPHATEQCGLSAT
jgi:hypothetical protein